MQKLNKYLSIFVLLALTGNQQKTANISVKWTLIFIMEILLILENHINFMSNVAYEKIDSSYIKGLNN